MLHARRPGRRRVSRRRVHPRFVWAGLTLAIVGALVLGVGIVMLSWVIALAGALLGILGAVIGVLGGALNDARPELAVGEELRQVVRGDVHAGVAPGEMIDSASARREARRTSEVAREILGGRRSTGAPVRAAALVHDGLAARGQRMRMMVVSPVSGGGRGRTVLRSALLVALLLLGLRRALGTAMDRDPAPRRIRLRYRVPVGQDAAAVLAAVRHNGFEARVEMAGGDEALVITCGASEKERVRQVLADAPVDMAGHPFAGPPVAFVGE